MHIFSFCLQCFVRAFIYFTVLQLETPSPSITGAAPLPLCSGLQFYILFMTISFILLLFLKKKKKISSCKDQRKKLKLQEKDTIIPEEFTLLVLQVFPAEVTQGKLFPQKGEMLPFLNEISNSTTQRSKLRKKLIDFFSCFSSCHCGINCYDRFLKEKRNRGYF